MSFGIDVEYPEHSDIHSLVIGDRYPVKLGVWAILPIGFQYEFRLAPVDEVRTFRPGNLSTPGSEAPVGNIQIKARVPDHALTGIAVHVDNGVARVVVPADTIGRKGNPHAIPLSLSPKK